MTLLNNKKINKIQKKKKSFGQDGSIYILDVILGRVYDIISHLIGIFYTFFKLKNISGTNANRKRRFHSFMEFYVIDLAKKSKGKNLIIHCSS